MGTIADGGLEARLVAGETLRLHHRSTCSRPAASSSSSVRGARPVAGRRRLRGPKSEPDGHSNIQHPTSNRGRRNWWRGCGGCMGKSWGANRARMESGTIRSPSRTGRPRRTPFVRVAGIGFSVTGRFGYWAARHFRFVSSLSHPPLASSLSTTLSSPHTPPCHPRPTP
jgi:hypothetical protein